MQKERLTNQFVKQSLTPISIVGGIALELLREYYLERLAARYGKGSWSERVVRHISRAAVTNS